MGGIYTSNTNHDLLSLKDGKRPFIAALRTCILEHPILSTVILGAKTESPEFATPKTLDLEKHIQIRDSYDLAEDSNIERILGEISDEEFTAVHTTPPWKVVLVPFSFQGSNTPSKLFVVFAYCHSHGDGKSGLAFNNSFLRGLSQYFSQAHDNSIPIDFTCEPPLNDLLPPIEKAGKLSLSWSFLLSPLLGEYLPTSLASLLGIRASWLPQNGNIWRGQRLTFDPDNFCTGVVVLSIDSATMSGLLQNCKAQQTTFTGVLNHVIARSLSASNNKAISANLFTSQIPVSMRHLFNGVYPDDSMTNCASVYNETIPRQPCVQPFDWAAARDTSAGLARTVSTLHNQPIGLLQYLNDFRSWTLGQIGKERDSSFEISNLGVFRPGVDSEANQPIKMEKAVFSQPATASGALLNFNPVSVQGGPLVMTVTWQRGVLDLVEGQDETTFVREICSRIEAEIRVLAQTP